MIGVEEVHHLLGLGDLGKAGKAAQVAEQHDDLAPVMLQDAGVVAVGDDEVGDLRRQEALQAARPLELVDLLR